MLASSESSFSSFPFFPLVEGGAFVFLAPFLSSAAAATFLVLGSSGVLFPLGGTGSAPFFGGGAAAADTFFLSLSL